MNAALYANYNPNAVQQAAQQLMSGQLPQNNPQPPPVQKKKVFAKLTPPQRGFYSNLLTKADKKGIDRIQGADAVAFLKCSGLQKDILKKIWGLSAFQDPKFLNKEQFYVALKLIAYAQNKMDVSIDSVITNLPVDLPKFNFDGPSDPSQQQNAKSQQAPKINVEQLPDLDSINPMTFQGSSFLPQQQQQQQQFSTNAAVSSPFFIAPQQLNKYKRIYEGFDKQKKGFLESSKAKEIFQKTGLSTEILKKVWMMVDFMDRGIIDNFAFIMSMHLLHRCKKGQALPNSIPEQMWASFGQAGVIYRQQLASVNAMKMKQKQEAQKNEVAAPPSVNLLNDSVIQQSPRQQQSVKSGSNNFGNLIADSGFEMLNNKEESKSFNFQLGGDNQKNHAPRSTQPQTQIESNFLPSPRMHSQTQQLIPPVAITSPDPLTNIQKPVQSFLSPPPAQISAPIPTTMTTTYQAPGVKNVNKILQNEVQFLQNQTSANNQIIRGVQTEVQRMQARRFQLQRYLQQLRQTIRNQTQEL